MTQLCQDARSHRPYSGDRGDKRRPDLRSAAAEACPTGAGGRLHRLAPELGREARIAERAHGGDASPEQAWSRVHSAGGIWTEINDHVASAGFGTSDRDSDANLERLLTVRDSKTRF